MPKLESNCRLRKAVLVIYAIAFLLLHPAAARPHGSSDGSDDLIYSRNVGTESQVLVEVCRRPLPKWAGSRNWFRRFLNQVIIHHLHHSYISFVNEAFIPTLGASIYTMGIHPIDPANRNKQPLPDQATDSIDSGGECRPVMDATPEKMNQLATEIGTGVCYSCGKEYHNRVLSGCYNNSNTYVYDLIRGAGMTPPRLRGAPGYRRHHHCRPW